MTGPEHYKAAERLLHNSPGDLPTDIAACVLAEAQVHATLALAAATALGSLQPGGGGMPREDAGAWQAAAGVPPEDYDVTESVH